MSRITAEMLDSLNKPHLQYCSDNQTIRSDDALMVKLGHPCSQAFTELRAFFDTLSYACNSSARLYSFKNQFEQAQFWAPGLDLSWYPQGDLRRFGHVYPAHEQWEAYLEAAAAAGWPAELDPSLGNATWTIRTQNVDMRQCFAELKAKHGDGYVTLTTRIDEETSLAYYEIDVSLWRNSVETALALHSDVVDALLGYHSDYVLPARLPEQNALESATLPLSEKTFRHGNVDVVTVTDRHVMVPLLALPADMAVVGAHLNRLEDLLEQGFRFSEAQAWLKKVLKPEAFDALKKQYGR